MSGPASSDEFRMMAVTSAFAAIIPLPVLVAIDPAKSADVASLYLGLATAWLVTEYYRTLGLPESLAAWLVRMRAISVAVGANLALFVAFGLAAGVRTRFPFPLMALLSAIPALGILPWMLRRVGHPLAAIILGATLVFLMKLIACVVARLVYGPDYLEQGYAAGDWHTAKLMISLFWSLTTVLSVGMLMAEHHSYKTPVSATPTPVI
jgi:hypothetical protein